LPNSNQTKYPIFKMRSFLNTSYEKFNEYIDDQSLKHLLNRVLFGLQIEVFNKLKGKNIDDLIEIVFSKSIEPLPPVNHYENTTKDSTGVSFGDTWVNSAYGDGTINSRRRQSLRSWWIQRLYFQDDNITEKMILFWHNHFATEMSVYDDARMGYRYLNTIRKHAFGNFKELVKAISIDPAMLIYLNGNSNTKTAPDENYARELMELFTLGKGPNSNFTEEDIKSAAKILTGYRINRNPLNSYFQANRHDSSNKTFSSFFNNKVIEGHSGDYAQNELDDLINMIFEVEEVSLYLVRRLYLFFFYYEITPEVESNFIKPIAKIFRENNFEVLPILKIMFSSQHFFDLALRGCMIKSPIDHLIGTTKLLDPSWPDYKNSLTEYYLLANDLFVIAEREQQKLLDPPSVAGWPAYHQSPVFYSIWINSSTLPERTKFTDNFVSKGYRRNNQSILFNPISFLKKFKKPEDPNALMNELEFWLLNISISQSLKMKLKKDILLDGQDSDYYWTELWNDALNIPSTNNLSMVNSRLKSVISYLIALPEYQLS
jgi:uncharacterized protein (DUF1800 family)